MQKNFSFIVFRIIITVSCLSLRSLSAIDVALPELDNCLSALANGIKPTVRTLTQVKKELDEIENLSVVEMGFKFNLASLMQYLQDSPIEISYQKGNIQAQNKNLAKAVTEFEKSMKGKKILNEKLIAIAQELFKAILDSLPDKNVSGKKETQVNKEETQVRTQANEIRKKVESLSTAFTGKQINEDEMSKASTCYQKKGKIIEAFKDKKQIFNSMVGYKDDDWFKANIIAKVILYIYLLDLDYMPKTSLHDLETVALSYFSKLFSKIKDVRTIKIEKKDLVNDEKWLLKDILGDCYDIFVEDALGAYCDKNGLVLWDTVFAKFYKNVLIPNIAIVAIMLDDKVIKLLIQEKFIQEPSEKEIKKIKTTIYENIINNFTKSKAIENINKQDIKDTIDKLFKKNIDIKDIVNRIIVKINLLGKIPGIKQQKLDTLMNASYLDFYSKEPLVEAQKMYTNIKKTQEKIVGQEKYDPINYRIKCIEEDLIELRNRCLFKLIEKNIIAGSERLKKLEVNIREVFAKKEDGVLFLYMESYIQLLTYQIIFLDSYSQNLSTKVVENIVKNPTSESVESFKSELKNLVKEPIASIVGYQIDAIYNTIKFIEKNAQSIILKEIKESLIKDENYYGTDYSLEQKKFSLILKNVIDGLINKINGLSQLEEYSKDIVLYFSKNTESLLSLADNMYRSYAFR